MISRSDFFKFPMDSVIMWQKLSLFYLKSCTDLASKKLSWMINKVQVTFQLNLFIGLSHLCDENAEAHLCDDENAEGDDGDEYCHLADYDDDNYMMQIITILGTIIL